MYRHSETEEIMDTNANGRVHDESNEWLAGNSQQPASASVIPSIMEASTEAWLTQPVRPIRANVTFVQHDQTVGNNSAGQRQPATNTTATRLRSSLLTPVDFGNVCAVPEQAVTQTAAPQTQRIPDNTLEIISELLTGKFSEMKTEMKAEMREEMKSYLTMSLGHQCESSPLPQQVASSFPAPVVTAVPVVQNPPVIPMFQPVTGVAPAATMTPVATMIPAAATPATSQMQSGARLSKPLTELPKFDGSGDLSSFKILFDEAVTLNGWQGESVKLIWLKQCVTGAAKQSILHESLTSCQQLWDILDNRYGTHLLEMKYTRLLERRQRQPNESINDLANDIRRMVEVVYAHFTKTNRECMAIKAFVSALPGPEIKYELSKVNPKTLDEAIQLAHAREVHFGPEFPFIPTTQSRAQPAPQPNPLPVHQPQQSRGPTCRHCGANHPSYVCQPCRHCGGAHYDNKCPGNAQPIPQNSARQ